MKTAAGCIALLVALILLVGACSDYRDDATTSATNINQAYSDIHNQAAFDRDMAEANSRRTSEEIRAVIGAAFLVGGLLILKKS